jgi:hypothetical protein
MEVHHHSHTSRKKWTHYFWEFLMLFLAVFCGFMAENQREHYIEHQREKQYMRSMIDDLRSDSLMLEENIHLRKKRLQMIDSLVTLLSLPNLGGKSDLGYYFARSISPPTNIFSKDGTVQQLKSSGNLRLVRDRKLANAIMAYDQEIRRVLFEMVDEVEMRAEYRQLASKIFDTKIFHSMQQGDDIIMPLNTSGLFNNDPGLINELIGTIQYIKRVNIAQLRRSESLIRMAKDLLMQIRDEYGIKGR